MGVTRQTFSMVGRALVAKARLNMSVMSGESRFADWETSERRAYLNISAGRPSKPGDLPFAIELRLNSISSHEKGAMSSSG
jgi:hypothetical protein